jgi:thymidylate synthase (FAD)
MDPLFKVVTLARTENPQTVCWWAMRQDYSEDLVFLAEPPSEERAGELLIKHLLAGGRGHFGPLEHPQITLNAGWFPHSVMQQGRTHRVGLSWDVQSFRYTSQRIIDVTKGRREIEEVFYLRPVGEYTDRSGDRYAYTEDLRKIDLARAYDAAGHYAYQIRHGMAEEHARGLLPFDTRQHFVVSFNLRSLLHFADLRAKADAQLEIRQLCDLIWPELQAWAPQVAGWYEKNRMGKARLAP